MPADDGLPPPQLPPHRPVAPYREPGVPKGYVRQQVTGALSASDDPARRWREQVDRARLIGAERLQALRSGQSPLDPVKAHFVGSGKPPESTLDVASDLYRMFSHPFSSGTEIYQTARIEQLQKAFLDRHGDDMRDMRRALAQVSRSLDELAALADASPNLGDTRHAHELVEKKATMGDDLMERIQARLDRADDPDERQRLAALRDDLRSWRQVRDSRVEPERDEVRMLDRRGGPLEHEAFVQRSRLADAADKVYWASNGDQTTAQAATFAAAIYQLLLTCRSSLQQSLDQ